MDGSAGCQGSWWSSRELGLVLFPKEFVMLLLVLLWWVPLPLGFQVKLGLVRGKYIPAGLHAAKASYVSASSLGAFLAAIVRAVRSRKMPLANTPAVLNLLDGPVVVDPALHIICVRFRMVRRYFAYFPDEDARIFQDTGFDFWTGPWSWPSASSPHFCC